MEETEDIVEAMVFKRIQEDIEAYQARDPAARNVWEVVLLYQGFHALMIYRLSHGLWIRGFKFLGRFISQLGRWLTGIEIHPGAVIGRRFVIDHGAGVVIGETSNIGDDVTLYHDVTLGGVAPSVDSHEQVGVKRHPTLGDDVIVGSGAQILGPITVGKCARVGSNAVVSKDIPSGVTAVGIPARIVMPKNKKTAMEFHAYATTPEGEPDPLLHTIEDLRRQVGALMARVEELESGGDVALAGERDEENKKSTGHN